jgi:hypothetical protein
MATEKKNEETQTANKTAETPAAVTTHQEFLQNVDPKIMQALQAMENLKSTNRVERAIQVKGMEVVPGKPKMRDGAPVFDADGNQEKWDDSYYVEAGSMEGTVQLRVKQDQFMSLKVGEWYVAVGRIQLKTPYEGNRVHEVISYEEFQPLLGLPAAV